MYLFLRRLLSFSRHNIKSKGTIIYKATIFNDSNSNLAQAANHKLSSTALLYFKLEVIIHCLRKKIININFAFVTKYARGIDNFDNA